MFFLRGVCGGHPGSRVPLHTKVCSKASSSTDVCVVVLLLVLLLLFGFALELQDLGIAPISLVSLVAAFASVALSRNQILFGEEVRQ